jgi:hypothetical protein
MLSRPGDLRAYWASRLLRGINEDQLDAIPRVFFLLGQILYMHPLTMPIVAASLVFFFSAAGNPYRLFGWMYLLLLGFLFMAHAKPCYLAPAYPVVLAGGAAFGDGGPLEPGIIPLSFGRARYLRDHGMGRLNKNLLGCRTAMRDPRTDERTQVTGGRDSGARQGPEGAKG